MVSQHHHFGSAEEIYAFKRKFFEFLQRMESDTASQDDCLFLQHGSNPDGQTLIIQATSDHILAAFNSHVIRTHTH